MPKPTPAAPSAPQHTPTEPPPPPVLVDEPPPTLDPIPAPIALEAPAPPVLKSPKEWAKAKGTVDWQLAAAAAGEVWPIDKTLSESDFDEAIQRACSAQSG